MRPRNLAELHRRQAERLGGRPALRFKQGGVYTDLTWAEYRERAVACAAALASVGIEPGDRVGLLAENSACWLIADMGILAAGAVNVPPHAPLTAKQVLFQLQDAGVRCLFVSTAEQADKVRKVRGELPELAGVVAFDPAAAGDGFTPWEEFLRRGREYLARAPDEVRRREALTGPDSLATIMYTSGTTGNPKGVMLTHGNLLGNALAVHESIDYPPDSLALSWLPYSHIYARTIDHYTCVAAGATVALAESHDTIVQNLAEIQPTQMSSVPRFYEKLLAAVGTADAAATAERLRKVFGPRMRWLGCGGAPLPPAVGRALAATGILLLPGYGLTESSPVISMNRPGRCKIDTVGPPLDGVEVRIAADGEILTRGPHVMKGYWNNPEATAAAIDGDGWLHTGDLGGLDADGFLSITGRKKDLMVLSNGKKVVPSEIETLLVASPYIDQVVVHGEGRSFLTALVVPDWAAVRASSINGTELTRPPEVLAEDPAVLRWMQQRVDESLADVAGCERVRKVILLPRPFSVEAGELTVSQKLRRQAILDKYRDRLASLYT